MNPLTTELSPVPDADEWSLRVKTPAGVALEYRYPSEKQARFMAAVFALGPTRLPPAARMISVPRKRRKLAAKRSAELEGVTPDEIDSALDALG